MTPFPGSGNYGSPIFDVAGSETFVFQGIQFSFFTVGTTYGDTGFPNGTHIVGTGGFSSPENQMTISFETPVTEVGFNLEDELPGPESYNIAGFTVTGNDPSSLAFFGLKATNGDTISSIFIEDARDTNFAIGPVTFGLPGAATPEPATVALLGTGLAGLAVLRRRLVTHL